MFSNYQLYTGYKRYRLMDKQNKKIKKEEEVKPTEQDVDRRIVVKFKNGEGVSLGNEVDLELGTTKEALNEIIRALQQTKTENQKYSFFYKDQEIKKDLGDFIGRLKDFTTETVLPITYHPQALFYIAPVTRWSSSLQGHKESILSVQFSPDSRNVASASGDTTVRLWDLQTETPRTVCSGHKNWVLCVAFSPCNDLFASGGMDGLVCVFNLSNGSRAALLKGHTKWVTALAWEPVHLQEGGSRLISASKDNTLRIWLPRNGTCQRVLAVHRSCITKVLWSGSNQIYSSSEDKTVKVWNPEDGAVLHDLTGHAHWVNTISLNSDYVLRTGAYQPGLKDSFASLEEMKQSALKRYNKFVAGQAERLVSGSDDFSLILWKDKRVLKRMTGHSQSVNMVSFSPDGRFIVSASFDKSLRMWDGFTGETIGRCLGHVQSVYQISWSGDARMFVSGGKDSTLKVWDVYTKKLMFDLPGHSDEVYAVDWSPNGQKVVSGGKDKLIKIWKN